MHLAKLLINSFININYNQLTKLDFIGNKKLNIELI